jgi:hypothetical protein
MNFGFLVLDFGFGVVLAYPKFKIKNLKSKILMG